MLEKKVKLNKDRLVRVILFFIFIFTLVHFLKDITQDILRVASPLDIFGDIKEDISFLPNLWQSFFYYGLGGLSFIVEAFLLIAIPLVIRNGRNKKLVKWVIAGITYLIIFILTCAILDPRYNLFR